MTDAVRLLSNANVLFPRAGGVRPPPEVLLSWPRPNYINPEERGWEAPIILMIVLGITFLIFVARMWARLVISKSAGLDDVLVGLAMLPVLGLTISAVLAIRVYGFQWHAWDQTNETHISSREVSMAIELNYLAATTFVKISILCFYRRMSGSIKTAFVYGVWAMIVFCVLYSIIFAILIICTCTPVIGFFHMFDILWRVHNELTCRDEGAIVVACAIIGTVQDLFICLLPVLLIWNLKMARRQKAALFGIFGIGLITCVCGILRTYYATYVYYATYDITWYAYYGWIWTALEADFGMICASAPALKVFFKRYFSVSSVSGAYGSTNTPIPLSRSRGKPISLPSSHSANASHVEPNSRHGSVPVNGIKVSQELDVHVEEWESQTSFTSTRELTTVPAYGEKNVDDWTPRYGNIRTAFAPGTRSNSRAREADKDVERGQPADPTWHNGR